jgi:glutamate-1-semialdehyde 2,1-aminomutase
MEIRMSRVVAIVQARMGSSRFPGKVMAPLLGQPMIGQLLGRLRLARRVDAIALATSVDTSDDALAAFVKQSGFEVVRGPVDDVLARYVTAAERLSATAIVRITGDCPLVDAQIVDEVVHGLLDRNADYASNVEPPTFPDGLDVEAFSVEALDRCASGELTLADREHVTLAMRRGSFRRWSLQSGGDWSGRRWTVDQHADLEVVRAVFSHFAPRTDFGWREVLDFLDSHPAIESANRHIPRNEGMSMTNEAKTARAQTAQPADSGPRWRERLLRVIPGGAHTYSRGFDQFPANAPEILERGEGVHVFDPEGRKYLDFGMALASVGIGYAEPSIVEAAARGMRSGNGLSRPSVIELEAAELFVSRVRSADMVKFTKNGSTAVTAAVKLARAHTGRDLVLRCAQHPFFSYDDWFIGSTTVQRGIPESIRQDTLLFDFNDAAGLERLLSQHRGRVAAVVLEPATAVCPAPVGCGAVQGPVAGCCGAAPCSAGICGGRNFLHEVQDLCRTHGALMVLDEMITGFRWHIGGAQELLGIQPDISTFGKAMANGFSVACVAGRREVMEHGSIEFEGRERVFLLSTTHGAEMCGLSAFIETIAFMERNDVCAHVWRTGAAFIEMFNEASRRAGTWPHVRVGGPACKPALSLMGRDGAPSMPLRTLFMQEMMRHGVIMPQVTIAFRHGEAELAHARRALDAALPVVAEGLRSGIEPLLLGPAVKPVFRRFN